MAALAVFGEFAVADWFWPRGVALIRESVLPIYSVGFIFTALYAAACGATMFAGEKESGTHEFLHGMPLSARRILAGKIGFAAISASALLALLLAAALFISGGATPDRFTLSQLWGLWGFAVIEVFVWGMLFSLLIERPLLATVLAVAATAVCITFIAWLLSEGRFYFTNLRQYSAATPRLLIATIVFFVDVWLADRFFGGSTMFPLTAKWRLNRRIASVQAELNKSPISPTRGAVLGRLIWQTWRQSRWLMICIAVVGALFALTPLQELLRALPLFDRERLEGMRPALAIAIAAALMGSCVFLADQESGRLRILTEQGISPHTVWLARELTWICVLAVWAFVVHGLWFFLDGGPEFLAAARFLGQTTNSLSEFRYGFEHLPPISVSLGLTFTSFACGQLASMLFRSGIVAVVVGGFLSLPVAVWLLLMHYFDVNWFWSVAPISLALFLATWLRASDWALGRQYIAGLAEHWNGDCDSDGRSVCGSRVLSSARDSAGPTRFFARRIRAINPAHGRAARDCRHLPTRR